MQEQPDIVVTGGSSGVGKALVSRLSERGCRVFNLDRHADDNGVPNCTYIACDLANENSIDAAVAKLPAGISGLANVAGIAQSAEAAQVLAVNFFGLRHLTESLIPRLDEGAGIVSVSSVAGRDWLAKYDLLKPLLETRSMSEGIAWCEANNDHYWRRDPYSFSKKCVTAYTLRQAGSGIPGKFRINAVSPGPIATPLYPEFESLMTREHSDWTIAQTQRAAQPNDIAEVLEFLVIGECGWLNGVDIPVDGGYTSGLDTGWIDFESSPAYVARMKRKSGRQSSE
jgi:NAD(P)-dependent dehydrogenase (short-subunit alcohol dehydrogenase family)